LLQLELYIQFSGGSRTFVYAMLCITASRDLTSFGLRYTLQTSTYSVTWQNAHTTHSTTI